MKDNKKILYLVILIALIIIVVTVSTYAYFQSRTDVNVNAPLNVATANGSVFTASSEGDIVLDVTFDKMTKANISNNIAVTDNATLTIRLDNDDENSQVSCVYDLVWVWDSTDKYTESDVDLPYTKDGVTYPYELSTKVDGENETDLSDLSWTTTEGITEAVIASKEISVNGKGSTTNTHTVDVQVYNIPTDQQNLFNKKFNAHIEVKNNKCMSTERQADTQIIATVSNNSHIYDGTEKTLDINVTNAENATVYYSTTTELTADNYTSGSTTKPTRSEDGQTTVYWCAVAKYYKPYCSSDKIIVIGSMANYITGILYTEDGANGLYYHDGNGTYPNANLEAGDNSYRYAGTDPDNYLCFKEGCTDAEKFRIIGVIDNKVKVIKMTSVGKKNWDYFYENTWESSDMEIYLNGNYLTSLGDNDKLIDTITWHVGGASTSARNVKKMYTAELSNTPTIYRKIGLMYVSDYGYAAEPTYWSTYLNSYSSSRGSDWMFLGTTEWTISRMEEQDREVYYVRTNGQVSAYDADESMDFRPVFNLLSSVKYVSGSGTSADPFIVTQ